MNTETALKKINQLCSKWYNTPIGKNNNKGKIGMLIERMIGLCNCSDPLDFSDGELKTISVKEY